MARWSPAVLDRASLENFFAVIENDDAIDDAHQDRHHVLDPNDADPEFYADSAKHVGRLIHLGNIEAAETLVPRAGSPAAWRARASSSFFKGAGSSTSVLSPSLVDRTLLACIFGSRRRRNLRRGDGTDAMPYVERVVLPGVRNG
jgi:hypothetical protein